MGVMIRLQRAGARNRAFYRIVVTDSRKPRDGAFLEKVGYYDPVSDPDVIHLEKDRVTEWMGKGAKPTDAVRALIRRWEQRGSGEDRQPAAESPKTPATPEKAPPKPEEAPPKPVEAPPKPEEAPPKPVEPSPEPAAGGDSVPDSEAETKS